ncbi:hypothetical protein ACFYKT_14105 [Cytobacillus sp. FJAT-53684]|uniref:t-SNARE coiled-coil homology domain-containing protein n=1 Tax=Cytobacillus mangrovibacter TaxID=3299024 RepID=A0ABW6K3D9_9BACI
MDQSGIQEILKALELHSEHIDNKITDMKVQLENRMDEKFDQIDKRFEQMDKRFEQVDRRFEQVDKRFEQMDKRFERLEDRVGRVESKLDSFRVELLETQENIDHLTIKNVRHERKLRNLIDQN